MIEVDQFELHHFLSLSGQALSDYSAPLLATRSAATFGSVYELLVSKLTMVDEQHLVYALEICMLLKSEEFIEDVVAFLSHTDASVCCTAYRLLANYPHTLLPNDFVRRIAVVPVVELFAPSCRSDEKVRVGTNAEFLHSLTAKFA